MTTFARPEDYTDLEPLQPDASVAVLTRIAVALEQIALEMTSRQPMAPTQPLAALPPVQRPVANGSVGCPIHNLPWKTVPAGISKKTGQPYDAFLACQVKGCDQRPAR